jgi:hypothetical protein
MAFAVNPFTASVVAPVLATELFSNNLNPVVSDVIAGEHVAVRAFAVPPSAM